jgi:cobalt-zinc-cadmium efflux system outer membrane protein
MAATAALSLWTHPAAWAQQPLTLERALARAREQNPAIVSARGRVEEARARRRGASALRDNPVVEASAGRRRDENLPADLELEVSQTLELGGRRGARTAAAEAAVTRAVASADEAVRTVLRDVATAFHRTIHAQQRGDTARAAETHAIEVQRVAEKRRAVGDVADLDVNLAASALARARSDLRAAEASRAAAFGALRVLLDLPPEEPLELSGDLLEAGALDMDRLSTSALERPDIRALEAEVREAEAESRLGRGFRWPDVSPGIRYERDEGQRVLWAGLTVTLPVFNRGQELRAVSEARVARARGELGALRRAVRTELAAAADAYRLRVQAADELRATVAALDDNEALARRSYEVGQIGLAEFLLIRRETVDTRAVLLDRLLEAAEARTEVLARGGVFR